MDETNLNIHLSRTEKRSLRESRCSTVDAATKGANVHVITAISTPRLIHYELRRGSLMIENAVEWFKSCIRVAVERHGRSVVIVIDNAPCHTNVEPILKKAEFSLCKILRLRPYSPMFNLIENIWSLIKYQIKRELPTEVHQIIYNREQNLSVTEQCLRVLERLMHSELDLVTPAVCISCISSIQSKISSALNLKNMQF
ncbi:hypothetical protein CDIK_0391 [Cucumispora dikerogammari]|nr:hypothetical protein CDIK_0391 [Cucumispora dikerogammari]